MANTGDNYGAVLEALNEKMDRDVENRGSGVETVVEHWHEGTEWYRVWSDGFIEQGGSIPLNTSTKTFSKAFVNTPLTVTMTVNTSVVQGNDSAVCTATNTTMTFPSASGALRWYYACGY